MQHIFSALMFMPVVSDSQLYWRSMKDIAVDSETVCLWLVDHSYDRAIKDSVLSIAKVRF